MSGLIWLAFFVTAVVQTLSHKTRNIQTGECMPYLGGLSDSQLIVTVTMVLARMYPQSPSITIVQFRHFTEASSFLISASFSILTFRKLSTYMPSNGSKQVSHFRGIGITSKVAYNQDLHQLHSSRTLFELLQNLL